MTKSDETIQALIDRSIANEEERLKAYINQAIATNLHSSLSHMNQASSLSHVSFSVSEGKERNRRKNASSLRKGLSKRNRQSVSVDGSLTHVSNPISQFQWEKGNDHSISNDSFDKNVSYTHDEEEDKHHEDMDETVTVALNEDSFSLMMLSSPFTFTWWYGIAGFALQTLLFCIILNEQSTVFTEAAFFNSSQVDPNFLFGKSSEPTHTCIPNILSYPTLPNPV